MNGFNKLRLSDVDLSSGKSSLGIKKKLNGPKEWLTEYKKGSEAREEFSFSSSYNPSPCPLAKSGKLIERILA